MTTYVVNAGISMGPLKETTVHADKIVNDGVLTHFMAHGRAVFIGRTEHIVTVKGEDA